MAQDAQWRYDVQHLCHAQQPDAEGACHGRVGPPQEQQATGTKEQRGRETAAAPTSPSQPSTAAAGPCATTATAAATTAASTTGVCHSLSLLLAATRCGATHSYPPSHPASPPNTANAAAPIVPPAAITTPNTTTDSPTSIDAIPESSRVTTFLASTAVNATDHRTAKLARTIVTLSRTISCSRRTVTDTTTTTPTTQTERISLCCWCSPTPVNCHSRHLENPFGRQGPQTSCTTR